MLLQFSTAVFIGLLDCKFHSLKQRFELDTGNLCKCIRVKATVFEFMDSSNCQLLMQWRCY